MLKITARELVRLLLRDGWKDEGPSRHGIKLSKLDGDRKRVTQIPTKKYGSRSAIIPQGTLSAILSDRQTGLGRQGLQRLIDRLGR